MPLFEYTCSSCRRDFEVMEIPGTHPHSAGCPRCGGRDLTYKMGRFLAMAPKKGPEPEDPDDDDEDDVEDEDEDEDEDDEGEEFPGQSELN